MQSHSFDAFLINRQFDFMQAKLHLPSESSSSIGESTHKLIDINSCGIRSHFRKELESLNNLGRKCLIENYSDVSMCTPTIPHELSGERRIW